MKTKSKITAAVSILSVLVMSRGSTVFAADPATQPTADSVLADMDAAYAKLQTAEFDGHIVWHLDAQGQHQNEDVAFTSSFASPNKFRHQAKDDVLLGSTGVNVYAYMQDRQQYENFDAPKGRAASTDWPQTVDRILVKQNPSLLLAVSKSAAAELKELSKDITLQPPTVDGAVSYDTLQIGKAADGGMTLLIDPATHLLHQITVDMRPSLEKQGAKAVKQAELMITYNKTTPDGPVPDTAFAWAAPVGAVLTTETVALADGGGDDGMSDGLKGMVGKDAPDFAVKGLDDKDVRLSELKGSVVIVDFWATWCGPCVASLPHLDKLYADKSGEGLKVLAVNLKEDKDKVQAFVDKKGWKLPVVLDSDGSVAEAYKAEAIPETVVVGKDGKIKKIFVGAGHEKEIAALVDAEVK